MWKKMNNLVASYEEDGYWGICSSDGQLYTGTWHTKKEAIDAHIKALHGNLDNRMKNWRYRRSLGDRCVKLRITYEWKA